MTTAAASIAARLTLDKSDYDSGLKAADSSANTFASKMRQVGGQMAGIGGTLIKGAFIGAAVGAAALGAELFKDVEAAMDAEKIQAQLNAVLRSTGGIAGVTADKVNQLADSLSGVTPFEDEAIIAGESMLLTFTNIGKDVFPRATETILDMSTALGQDLQGSAIQLGKALNDPIQGVTALRRVGVAFSDEQEKMIKTMVESGDLMGAQTFILDELQKEFGGSAKAAGQTFAGQLTILQTKLGNIRENIGKKLLPVLDEFTGMIQEWANSPEAQAFIENLGDSIATFAETVFKNIPKVLKWFKDAFGWLMANKGVIVAVLAVLTASVVAFAVSTIVAIGPVILVIAAIGLAAYLLYQAWTTNFGGIQEKTAALWAWLQPILTQIVAWLSVNIPLAISVLSTWWTNVLVPTAIEAWQFLMDIIDEALSFITDLTTGQMGEWSDIWTRTTGAIKAIFGLWATNIKLIGKAFTALFSGDWKKFGELLRMIWDNAWKAMTLAVKTQFANIKSALSSGLNSVADEWSRIDWSDIGRNLMIGIANGILGGLPSLLSAGRNVFTALGSFLSGFFGGGGGGSNSAGGGPLSCFIAGTLISMADGSRKPIEEVEIGDEVLSFENGFIFPATVQYVYHHADEEMSDDYLVINERVGVTGNHPIFVNGDWVKAENIVIGDKLKTQDGLNDVVSIRKVYKRVAVYNLHVDHDSHNYFANETLVHNKELGGTVYGNKPYMVGERGSELFVPRGTGKIVSNDKVKGMSGGGGTVNNYHPQITVYTGKADQKRAIKGFI